MSEPVETNTTWEQINANIMKKVEADGFTHYKGHAECFADVINAFSIISSYNKKAEWENRIGIITPTIQGSAMGDTDFDFWTKNPILQIQSVWDKEGRNIHRMIQTIKPFDKYDGCIDHTVWNKIKKYNNPVEKVENIEKMD